MAKKRRKKTSNYYFTKVHEEAIVKYSLSNSLEERTEYYIKFIQPAFHEMVDKIIYTYKFTNLPNIDVLKEECKIWLTTILDKYDPNKGSKAFSYFSVITKNWFIHKVKKNTQRNKREVQYEDVTHELERQHLTVHNEYYKIRSDQEFWSHLWGEINSWEQLKLKENEEKVLQAVKILFENCDNIEIFNKKAVYLYLREITGLNTKQVVNNLNKIREKYRIFRKSWVEGKI
tara:strand:+ start:851 stop:1543 length:693 start_codon:yes stop_codon:yes gene_type:complete